MNENDLGGYRVSVLIIIIIITYLLIIIILLSFRVLVLVSTVKEYLEH